MGCLGIDISAALWIQRDGDGRGVTQRPGFALGPACTGRKIVINHVLVQMLSDPAAPFAQVSGGTNEAMEFTVRAWCETADYWDVYFGLIQGIVEALGAAGVQAPAARIIAETKQ